MINGLGSASVQAPPIVGSGLRNEPVIAAELFDAVQEIRKSNASIKRCGYERSGATLAGLIHDDAGNRMTPVHVKKGNVRYHYYQSWVLAHGQKAKAGSVFRVPVGEIEQVVTEAIAKHLDIIPNPEISKSAVEVIRDHLDKLVVHHDRLVVTLRADDKSSELENSDGDLQPQFLAIAWSKPSPVRKSEVLGHDDPATSTRPIRSEARTRLLKAIAQGRHWLDQIKIQP